MAQGRLSVVIDDIRKSIKQTFDDKEVTRAQVAYWTIIVANKLLGQHISKRDSGGFLTVYIVPVNIPKETVLPNIIKGRKYIELPKGIFDYDHDDGIEYMAYYDPDENCDPEYQKKTISRTTPAMVQWMKKNMHAKPSPENPYFWRASEIINLVGIEKVPVKEIEIGLYVTVDPLEKIDIDQPFNFPDELLSQLKREVTDLARFSFLFDSEKDTKNDGKNTAEGGQPIQKIASVNDQQQ